MAITSHDQFVRLARSRDLLADRAHQHITVADAAAAVGLSQYHYIRAFHRAFGSTPADFVQARRIARARQLLASSNLPVTDVCFEVGYESLGSFSTLFRRYTGLSPSEFRRRVGRVYAIRWAAQPVYIPACFLSFYGITEPQF